MKSDYRYDAGVFSSCASDVDGFCAEAKSKLRGNASVLKCLVNHFKQVSAPIWAGGSGGSSTHFSSA